MLWARSRYPGSGHRGGEEVGAAGGTARLHTHIRLCYRYGMAWYGVVWYGVVWYGEEVGAAAIGSILFDVWRCCKILRESASLELE